MASNNGRSDWSVLLGVGLLVLGAWLLLERVFGWLAWPLGQAIRFFGQIGWPLVLVGLGVFLIMQARSDRWNLAGRKLYRSRTDRKIGGVLGGAAVLFDVDATWVRLGYAALTLLTGFWPGFLLYVVAMIVVPEAEFSAGVQAPSAAAAPAPAAPPVPPMPSKPEGTPAETPATPEAPAPPASPATPAS